MSSRREILVLQVTGEEVRLACASVTGSSVRLSDTATFCCTGKHADAGTLRDQVLRDAMAAQVARHGWIAREVICVVGGGPVAVQHFEMPPLRGTALRQAVRLKLGSQLHFDANQALLAIRPTGDAPTGAAGQVGVEVCAIERETARSVVDMALEMGLVPMCLTLSPAVISRLARERDSARADSSAVLHVDERTSTLVVLRGSAPVVTSELDIGAAELTRALMRPIISGESDVQLDEAAALALRAEVGIPAPDQEIASLGVTGDRLLPLLEPAIQKFARQLTQWLTFATTCNGGAAVTTMQIVGPGAAIPGLARTLAARLAIEIQPEHWLADWVSLEEASAPGRLDGFAVAAGAARWTRQLPDLMPPEVLRQRRVRRVRRSIAVCGPILAAAIGGLAVLFDHLGSGLSITAADRRQELAGVEQIVEANTRWAEEQARVRALEGQFDAFCRASPSWVGVFKELSLLLPSELRALEYSTRAEGGRLIFTVRAGVYTAKTGRSFDEVVAQALLVLQRSAFFRRVELVSAQRGQAPEDPASAGSLAVQLELVVPQAGRKA
jgi:Tfp pilus assembly PilM family ATPase